MNLEDVSERNEVTLILVPCHSCMKGNKKVEKVASRRWDRMDTSSNQREDSRSSPANVSTCRQAKEFMWSCDQQTTKGSLRVAVEVLTGHLNTMGLTGDSNCRECGNCKAFPLPLIGLAGCLGDRSLTVEDAGKLLLATVVSSFTESKWPETKRNWNETRDERRVRQNGSNDLRDTNWAKANLELKNTTNFLFWDVLPLQYCKELTNSLCSRTSWNESVEGGRKKGKGRRRKRKEGSTKGKEGRKRGEEGKVREQKG